MKLKEIVAVNDANAWSLALKQKLSQCWWSRRVQSFLQPSQLRKLRYISIADVTTLYIELELYI